MKTIKAAIQGITSYLPNRKLTNAELAEEFVDWSADKILQKTGIAVRSIAAEDECASDLGVAAARRLFESGACSPDEVDFLLFCTQSPDYIMPTTACLVQERLGLRTNCGGMDFNLGCSGFVYGLSLAKGLIETGTAGKVLLITSETYSKYINPRDRSVRTIFSDGAAATLIGGIESENEPIGPFIFGTDGSGGREVIVPAGGARRPLSAESAIEAEDQSGNWRADQDLYMNGPEVFNFAIRTVPRVINQLLASAGRDKDDVDCFIFHQANRFMLEHLRDKLKIRPERFWIDLENYGNTVSSTIPIALESARKNGTITAGDNVAVIGFGVGYSWAAAMVRVT